MPHPSSRTASTSWLDTSGLWKNRWGTASSACLKGNSRSSKNSGVLGPEHGRAVASPGECAMKLSDYVIRFIAGLGVKHVFLVPGGGAMHLNDSLARCPDIAFVCNLHEQA